jgi:uncharacterized membrane protein YgcG
MQARARIGQWGGRTHRNRLLRAAAAAIALALILAPLALAFDLPPSQAGKYVYDFAGIWSSGVIDSAQQTADRLRSQTGVEMAVVSIPTGESSVSTSEAEQTAKDIMDAWGVGQAGVDNGIVVLFDLDTSLRHGQIYVYGGRGIVSKYLSPAAAQSVANDMIDRAKAGDLVGALTVGMREIADAVDNPGSRLESAPLLEWPGLVVVVLDVLVLAGAFALWWRDGRDPPIPLIDDSVLLPAPPPGLTPSMAALLHDGIATKNAPAAALVDLASRNLIGMREGHTLLGIGHKPIDFIVSDPYDPRVAHAEMLTGEPERLILHSLRGIATNGIVEHDEMHRLSSLQSQFATALGRAAAATPWFKSDPNAAMNRVGLLPIAAFLAVFVVLFFGQDQLDGLTALVAIAATVIAVAVGALFARAMAARTTQGSWALGMAMAYRNTLRHEMGVAPGVITAHEAVKLKMPWLETPDALIVWAVALGLADEVGHLIGRSVHDPASANWHPVWYTGSAASFASFGSSISSISVTAASSSGGGFSGGSSGGGGGGGGGF